MRYLPYLAVATAFSVACSEGPSGPSDSSPQFARGNPPPPPITTTSGPTCSGGVCEAGDGLEEILQESFQFTGLIAPGGAAAWLSVNPVSVSGPTGEFTITSVSPGGARIAQTRSGISGHGIITAIWHIDLQEDGIVDVPLAVDLSTVSGTLIAETTLGYSFDFELVATFVAAGENEEPERSIIFRNSW